MVTKCQYRCTTGLMGACLLSLNGNVELNTFTRPEHPLLYISKIGVIFMIFVKIFSKYQTYHLYTFFLGSHLVDFAVGNGSVLS